MSEKSGISVAATALIDLGVNRFLWEAATLASLIFFLYGVAVREKILIIGLPFIFIGALILQGVRK